MTTEYVADNLVTAIRRNGNLSPSDETAASTVLYHFMNQEQRGYLTRKLMSVREGYLRAASTSSIVASQTEYDLPARAIAGAIISVERADAGGDYYFLAEMPTGGPSAINAAGGDYYVSGNKLVLTESPSATAGSLRFTYHKRLSRLVPQEEAGYISAINTGTKQVTISSTPANWTTSNTFDFVKSSPHFDVLGEALVITTLASNVMTFSATLPTTLAVGHFVSLTGQTPVCQAPLELHDLLAARSLFAYMKAKADPRVKTESEWLRDVEDSMLAMIAERVDDEDERVLNTDGPGWSSSNTPWRWRF